MALQLKRGVEVGWLAGTTGDALHAVLCAAGFNLRWLLRAIVCGRIKPIFFGLFPVASVDHQSDFGDADVAGRAQPTRSGESNVRAAACAA